MNNIVFTTSLGCGWFCFVRSNWDDCPQGPLTIPLLAPHLMDQGRGRSQGTAKSHSRELCREVELYGHSAATTPGQTDAVEQVYQLVDSRAVWY